MKVKLIDVCDIQYGYAFDSKCFIDDESCMPLIRIRDVKRGFSETYYSGIYSDEYIINSGDLLIGMDGEFNIARWKSRAALLNQRVCKITAKPEICEEYIRFVLSVKLKEIERRTAFVTVKHLSAKELNKLELDIPEYDIQVKVADILQKIECIIDHRNSELVHLDELIKSRFVEMTELTDTMPTRMGDIATYVNGYAFKPVQWETSGYPIIRIQNLNDTKAPYNFYSGELADKFKVHNGDVLVSWATHLEAYIWRGEEAWLNQHIFKVVFDKMEVDKTYFVYACEEALRQAFRNAHGFKPTMEHIKKKDFDEAIVLLPDIQIQKKFAEFVHHIDKLKVKVQQSLEETQIMFDSLMQKYFG